MFWVQKCRSLCDVQRRCSVLCSYISAMPLPFDACVTVRCNGRRSRVVGLVAGVARGGRRVALEVHERRVGERLGLALHCLPDNADCRAARPPVGPYRAVATVHRPRHLPAWSATPHDGGGSSRKWHEASHFGAGSLRPTRLSQLVLSSVACKTYSGSVEYF